MIKILKEQFRFMDRRQVQVKNFKNFETFQKLRNISKQNFSSRLSKKKVIFNNEKGVTRALLKIAEFVEADLNDGLTGRTTKVLDNFMLFRSYEAFFRFQLPFI